MFKDILFILNKEAAHVHGQLIRDTFKRILPQARLRIIWEFKHLHDTSNVDVIVAPQVLWLSDTVARCPQLRWLHLLSAGAERIFDRGLEKGSFWISKSSGVNDEAIAEYVIGAMLFFTKQFHIFVHQQKEHRWKRAWLEELSGKKAVIVGLGHVGATIARYLAPMGIRITGVSRRAKPLKWVGEVFPPEKVQQATVGARFLIVAVPKTRQTRGMISHKVLFSLEKGGIIIDVSRGDIVVQDALIEVLNTGHLGGAVLDVFEEEPLPPDSKLWDLPNVLVTPHVAGTSDRFMERALEIIEKNLHALVNYGSPATPVDRNSGY